MPGTYVFKPVEANLTHNTDFIGKMNPYCTFTVGDNKVKGQICKKGGKSPHWTDAVTISTLNNQSEILVELMDKDTITRDDPIGSFIVDLQEVQATGIVRKWYPLSYKNEPAGDIFMESVFHSDNTSSQEKELLMGSMITEHGSLQGEDFLTTPTIQQEKMIIEEQIPALNVYTEQRHIVEPHTFMKDIDVVEIRSATQVIEVMEPVQVMKDVQYTQAMPVTKQIEVSEPYVVIKEVEVLEPRLVTKTIQVVENVPFIREVEVIEFRNIIQEVESMEPQTFTKQVEVLEYMPITKQVEVTEAVTVKKAMEYVESVTTTQTITKEIQPTIIVKEEITTTVGPVSIVDVQTEIRRGVLHKDNVDTYDSTNW